MYILINVFYFLAMIKWGDWRNWRQYYPTVLFFIVGDFLYNIMLYSKSMWTFHDLVLPNHTIITLLNMAVSYTATVLIYLGRFPERWIMRLFWFLLWVVIYLAVELFDSRFGFIVYHHGWNFGWSVVFTAVIFFILPLHYKNPLLAWVFSILVILSLMEIFHVKISDMK